MGCRRVLLLAAVLLAASGALGRTQTPHADRPRAVVAELDGIIHPIAAEYLTETINQADTSGADVVIVILRTPGGLLDSTRTIVSRMITSRAPVVVFVGPSGARAASAGFVITIAADVAVMAPGTHIGAAHPVSGSGQPMDDTTAKKAASDTAAYARSLAQARGRNVALAADAVLESRAFTDTEALQAAPPLIDFTAQDLDDLLRQLDGRDVRRFDGRTVTLDTTDAEVVRVDMTRRQRFLSAIAHPQVAYLLLTLGALGLTIELWNPGAIVPGVVGGLSLLLAFFALQILPVNTTGLLLILFGLGLLLLELKVPSFGVLGIGGTVSLLVGSIMLTREVPGLPGITVGLTLVVPVVLGLAAIFLFLGRLALQAQARPPTTGAEGMIGEEGRARAPLAPDAPGPIDVHGEIWRAVSREPVPAGAKVRIVEVHGLTLLVEPADTGRT
ncbi:MAG: nodulation protein NfeD [Acidobacteria bacterium]|nr:nodulation protein NfeD [Acidobacteriota bacterium]